MNNDNRIIISAGFVILSQDGKVLLGRTDKYNENGNWTVFKGQQEGKETLLETAIRELKEETGIDIVADDRLSANTSTSVFYSFGIKNKIVYLYLLHDKDGALNDFVPVCNSYWKDNCPEIIEYKWFDIDEIENYVFPSQIGMAKELKRIFQQ